MCGKARRIIAVFLCMAVCMTANTDTYAFENDGNKKDTEQYETGPVSEEPETEKTKAEQPEISETESETITRPETETQPAESESETETQPAEPETRPETETQPAGTESTAGSETEDQTDATETGTEDQTDTAETVTEPETETENDSETELLELETEDGTETETENETEPETKLQAETIITEQDIEAAEKALNEELNRKLESDGFMLSGYIDSGMEAQTLTEDWGTAVFSMSDFIPARYSAVEEGHDTSVKDQGDWGACWSFAAVAPAESIYKKLTGEERNLSEPHLINFFYNDDIGGTDGGLEGDAVIQLMTDKVNNGGNSMFTTFALARWTGIADEGTHASLVYPSAAETGYKKELDIPQEYAYTDLVHLQNAYWINKDNMDAIKEMIISNGAVAASYKHNESRSSNYVDKTIYSGPTVYYNNYNDGGNHAIAVVGWDDDFDRNNFNYIAINQDETFLEAGISFLPKNNGAWLIKNSWGTSYGDEGYFWMSYEDASLAGTMVAFDYEKADNYDHIYQYDGSAGVRNESGSTITTAAVYTGTGSQMIEAAGVGVASVETDYTIEIYTGLTDVQDPQSGKLKSTTTGRTTFQGYYTVELDETVTVTEGETFSIVVTLSGGRFNGEDGAAIFIDKSYDNGKSVRFVAKTNPGETFRKDGNTWKDAVDNGTYRIKAYTTDCEFEIPQEDIQLTPEMVREIDAQEYSGAQSEPEIEVYYMDEQLVRDTDFTVVYSNNITVADKTAGNAPRAVVTGIGKYTGTVEQTFTIFPKDITEEMIESTTLPYNGAAQEDLTLRNGGIPLTKETDYTISYNKQPCNAGTYTAVITGTNNYAGQVSVRVTIAKTPLTEDMVGLVDGTTGNVVMPEETFTCEYTGAAVKPTVKILAFGGEVPVKNYSVSYKQNTNAGTATVTVTGKGNCQGKVTRTFEILPKSIESGMTVSTAKATYSGKALTPAPTVKWNKKTLKKGKDYTITYGNNTDAAGQSDMEGQSDTAPYVIITGIGNYTGEVKHSFTINPKEIAENNVSVQIAYEERGSRLRVLAGNTELDETQYSAVIYPAGTDTSITMSQIALGGKYDIEITLRGNYRVKNKAYALKKNVMSKQDIGFLDIRFANEDAAYTYNAKAQKPKVEVKDADGKTVASSNYIVSYTNNTNAGTAYAVVTGKGAYAGTHRIPFEIGKKRLDSSAIQAIKDQTYTQKEIRPAVRVLDGKTVLKAGGGKDYTYVYGNNTDVTYDENGNVTAGAYVRIQLSGNYDIDEAATVRKFVIKPAAISSLSLSTAYYTGQAVLPDKVVVKAGNLEVPAGCCEVTADNNIQVSSKASLTVTAKPLTNYAGSKTKKYSIAKRELKKLILPVIPDQSYLKQPVTVDGYGIKDLDGQVVGTDQYDVTVKNNKKPGKATVTYKAKSTSIYKGSVTVQFNITKATMSQAVDYDAAQTVRKQYTGDGITLTDEELRRLAPIRDAADGYQLPYTVTYSRNVNAGKAVVRLTGKDYLHGSVSLTFTITPRSATAFEITTGSKQLSYNNGQPVRLELKAVTDGDTVLRAGKDYTCSYTNADKKGLACLTVTGVGNYAGTRYIYYKIS